MRRRTRHRATLGAVLAHLWVHPRTAADVAERAGVAPSEAEGLLVELRGYGLVTSGPGADGIVRWRRVTATGDGPRP